jgi:nucleoside 2-deoxyribosyltransferase
MKGGIYMTQFKIYCAHPITGLSGGEVIDYYTTLKDKLSDMGYGVLHPMVAKNSFRPVETIRSHGYDHHPMARDRAIKGRDQWMVTQADIVLVDLSGTSVVSIGCVSELAYADILGKHTVLVLPENNIHKHAFILQEADVIFENLVDALDYLNKLINGIT